MSKSLDDLFGAGTTAEIKDIAKHTKEVEVFLKRAEDYDRLARFFTWAAQRATHEAAKAAQRRAT